MGTFANTCTLKCEKNSFYFVKINCISVKKLILCSFRISWLPMRVIFSCSNKSQFQKLRPFSSFERLLEATFFSGKVNKTRAGLRVRERRGRVDHLQPSDHHLRRRSLQGPITASTPSAWPARTPLTRRTLSSGRSALRPAACFGDGGARYVKRPQGN